MPVAFQKGQDGSHLDHLETLQMKSDLHFEHEHHVSLLLELLIDLLCYDKAQICLQTL